MFSIYKFMYDNGMCDKSYLWSCVPDAGLSKVEYDQIVGDSNEREAQPTA
ncbi:XkdX family protein [Lactobacillus kitasatonis]|nr:XkdX family protein [Lactobacillus kitasatonis]